MTKPKIRLELEPEIAERLLDWLYSQDAQLDGEELHDVIRDHGRDSIEFQNLTRDMAAVTNLIELLELAGVGDDSEDDD